MVTLTIRVMVKQPGYVLNRDMLQVATYLIGRRNLCWYEQDRSYQIQKEETYLA